MKVGEIKRKISEQIRKQYHITINESKRKIIYNGYDHAQYLSIPFSEITEITNDRISIDIRFRLGTLALWKKVNSMHLTLMHFRKEGV